MFQRFIFISVDGFSGSAQLFQLLLKNV